MRLPLPPIAILYNLLIALALPFVFLRLLWKSRRNLAYRHHLSQRFAYDLPPAPAQCFWFHAVSVGEFIALKPLLIEILNRDPNRNLWITMTTPTGRTQVAAFAKLYPDRVVYSYFPYDFFYIQRRFIKHVQPRVAVFMETELWFNALHIIQQQHIPSYLINARLSRRSLHGYYRFARSLLAPVLKKMQVSAQHCDDARRLKKLGVPAENIIVLPTLKYVMSPKNPDETLCFLPSKQHWLCIAASTHAPEEADIIAAFKVLQKTEPQACLCIAPRHPERRQEISKTILAAGYQPKWRSRGEQLNHHSEIFLLDTIGELVRVYQMAEIAIIGGSFYQHGGQNPLEAIHAGCAVCFGASMTNFQHIAAELIHQPFVRQCRRETLAQTLISLRTLHYPREKIRIYGQNRAAEVLEQHYRHFYRVLS